MWWRVEPDAGSNPRRLVTQQVAWPVELIRHWRIVVRRAGIEPATFTYKRAVHTYLPAPTGLSVPTAGFEPTLSGFGNRCAIHCATRALARQDEVEPSIAEPQSTVFLFHHDRHGRGLLPDAEAEGFEPPAACGAAAR